MSLLPVHRRVPTTPLAALLACAAIAMLGLSCKGRPGPAKQQGVELRQVGMSTPHLGVLDLRGGVPEQNTSGFIESPRPRSFSDLVLRLETMRDNRALQGVLVRLGTASVPLARGEEIARHLRDVAKAKNQPRIVCHANEYTNSSLFLAASACDELWLTPGGNVSSVGIAAQLMFGRQLLDEMSVGVDFLQVGKYKGASDPFIRNDASPEARESLASTLRALRTTWVDGITKRRGRQAEQLGLESGPHPANEAKEKGLIDHIGFFEDVQQALVKKTASRGLVAYFGGSTDPEQPLATVLRSLGGTQAVAGPHIAILRATGAITMRPSRSLMGNTSGIDAQTLSRSLKQLARDDFARAVVLRIDSPGGSALASDLLWKAIMDLRKVKPVVVSIGGMAASGGYYLAAAGNHIVAESSSIIGSIGVVAGKLTLAKSLERIGVHVETVSPSADGGVRALYTSALMPWDDATRQKMLASIQSTYALFLSRIAKGRGVAESAIEPAAEGRIMGGIAAQKAGLVDAIGGLQTAVDKARSLAKVGSEVPAELIRDRPNLLEALSGSPQSRSPIPPASSVPLLELEAKAFLASMAPLLQSEAILTTMPFALVLR